MRGPTGVLVGLLLGVAVGVGGTLAVRGGSGGDLALSPATGGVVGDEHPATPSTVAALQAEVAELRARLEQAPTPTTAPVPARLDDAGATADTTPAGSEATAAANANAATPEEAAAAPDPQDPDAAFRAAVDAVRELLRGVRDEPAGSPAILALVKRWTAEAGGADAKLAQLAGRALLHLADSGKLRPEDVDALAGAFGALVPGSAGRPGLAAAVARAWARDPKLAEWFVSLPPVDEPQIRADVTEALDESPSDAYRDWLVRISQTERDPDVLDAAWHEDPITVALTREFAPRIIAAIEPRVAQGDLPPEVRGRAFFALGLAGGHEPAAASAAIGRLLASESDPAVRAYAQAVLEAIGREEANVQVLDGLWGQHRRQFGKQ